MYDVILPNRYGDKNQLECLSNSNDIYVYKLVLENPDLGVRVGYEDDDKKVIAFLDPPGGPYMEVGYYKLGESILKSITFQKDIGFVLTFE